VIQVSLYRIPDILEEHYFHLQGLSGSRRLDSLDPEDGESRFFYRLAECCDPEDCNLNCCFIVQVFIEDLSDKVYSIILCLP
jgi:hypothetical protein